MSTVEKVLPTNWMKTNLDNVCEILDSVRVPVNARERNNRTAGKSKKQLYPYYGATGEVGEIDGYLFDGEYLLLGEDGAPFLDYSKNTAYIVSGKFWVNNHAHILNVAISNKYLCHYLNQYDFSKSVTGTTRLKLNQSALKDIPILFAPQKEQHRIVEKIEELFSELDKGIESLKIAREQLKTYRQALLKHAFEGKLTEQWRKDNTGKLEAEEQFLERIEQERKLAFNKQVDLWLKAVNEWVAGGEIGRKPPKPRRLPTVNKENEGKRINGLPVSWHCLKLVDIVLSLGQGWSPKCSNTSAKESEWGVIKTTAIQNLNYLENENKQLPDLLCPRPWLKIIADDILITRAGPRNRVGVVCRVKSTRDKLMLCDKAYRMRFPNLLVSPAYIETLLNTSNFKRKIEKLKTGISDSGLNITQPRLLGLYFPMPPIEEQLEIEKILEVKLSVIEKNISYINENLLKSNALRQSILKKAFLGQLVLQDSSDEPASELLKRIAIDKSEMEEKINAAKKAVKKTREKVRKKANLKNKVSKKVA